MNASRNIATIGFAGSEAQAQRVYQANSMQNNLLMQANFWRSNADGDNIRATKESVDGQKQGRTDILVSCTLTYSKLSVEQSLRT